MGEVLLVCALITLILIVYFIYIKDKEENVRRKPTQQDYNYRQHINGRYYCKKEKDNYNYNKYDKSEEYLKFLKFKNTPPPQDIQPKKLRYENYYNYNYPENYYGYNNKMKILTPTPFKNEQVKAGNIYNNNYNIESNLNEGGLNYNPSHLNNYNNGIIDNNTFATSRNNKINYIEKNTSKNNNYVSKYPIELSNKKETDKFQNLNSKNLYNYPSQNQNIFSNFDCNYINSNQPNLQQRNYYNPPYNTNQYNHNATNNTYNNNFNQQKNYDYNPNQANYNINYKIINAEEYLKKTGNKIKTYSNVPNNNVLSSTPNTIGLYPVNNEIKDINNNINNNIYNYNYNIQNPNQNYLNTNNIEEEKIVPRKLRFSDATGNKFNITNKKLNINQIQGNNNKEEWSSPLEF